MDIVRFDVPAPIADKIEEYRYLVTVGRLHDAEMMQREMARSLAQSHPEVLLALEAMKQGYSGIEQYTVHETPRLWGPFQVGTNVTTTTKGIRFIK